MHAMPQCADSPNGNCGSSEFTTSKYNQCSTEEGYLGSTLRESPRPRPDVLLTDKD